MNTDHQTKIYTGLHNLIDYSCSLEAEESSKIESLHRALLKRYFEAEHVLIDRENNRITLEVKVNPTQQETKVIDVDVNFENFDTFLKSCIDKGENSLRFYQNLLRYYYIQEPVA